MDNVSSYTINKPTLTEFCFLDKNDNPLKEIKLVSESENLEVFIKAVFIGIDGLYLNYNEPREARHINFCIYEKNNSGKGYRIIDLLSHHLDLEHMNDEILEIKTRLITINNDLRPLQGQFEGITFDEFYNYNRTYLSLRIFYSSEEVTDIDGLDSLFYEMSNVVLDTKVPFRQVSSND